MKAYELDTEITPDGAIALPPELAAVLLPGQRLRVLLLVPEDGEGQGQEEWPKLTAEEFYLAFAGDGSEGEQPQ